MLFGLFGCGAKTYRVDYNGSKEDFRGARDAYRAGANVTLRYDLIATDTDYSFYLDGEYLNVSYREKDGYIIKFTMPDHDVSLEVKTSASMFEGIEEAQEYHLDNVPDAFLWIGKTPEEIGITEEYIDGGSSIYFEGGLFGQTVYGRAYLLNDRDSGTGTVDRIFLSCGSLSFEDAAAGFTKIYGRPYDMGEEPYVEVNGGAVMWQRFYTGADTVQISQASKQDYFTLDVTAGAIPDGYAWDLDRINSNTGYGISFDGCDFEDITYRHDTYTGYDIYGISYLYHGDKYDVDILASCSEVPESYLRYDSVSKDAEQTADGFEIKLNDDGSGAILWHEYYGSDIWIVFMNENAAEETLLQMKSLLQSTWELEV